MAARSRAGELALEIYGEVLAAVRADRLVEQAISADGDRLVIQSQAYDLRHFRRIRVAAVGKASVAMAQGAKNVLGERIDEGLIVTKQGYGEPVEGFTVLEAGHPVPDETSLAAGGQLLTFAQGSNESDFCLFLLSGGASALVESLPGDLTLEDLQATNEALLASGLDIGAINAVRRQISRIKGGRLSAAFGDATVVVLVLSDVVGNSLAAIGSGPFIATTQEVVSDATIRLLPERVRQELLAAILTPLDAPKRDHFVIGSVSLAIHAAADAARARGLLALAYQDPLRGEAREMARQIVDLFQRQAKALDEQAFCMIFGGETTVTLREEGGKGGRCQEMTLAAVPGIAKVSHAAFLAAGTDGTDGPTDAAGGLVETATTANGRSQRADLVSHNAYFYLEAADALVRTGPTGSNLNDICLVIRAPI